MKEKDTSNFLSKETAIEQLYVRETFLWKVRWAVLGWLLLWLFIPKNYGVPVAPGLFLLCIGIIYNAAVTFAVSLRYKTSLSMITFLFDSMFITLAVYLSGGINSELWPLYFMLVVSASMVLSFASEFVLLAYVSLLFFAATVSNLFSPFYFSLFANRVFLLGAVTFAVNFIAGTERALRQKTESIAMENAGLYERVNSFNEELQKKIETETSELKKKYSQLEILYKTHKLISSDIELEKILSFIIKGVQEGLGFDRVGIFEVDTLHNIIKGRMGVDRWGKPENIENQVYSMDADDNNFAKMAKGTLEYFFTEDADNALPPSQKKYMVPGVGQNMVVQMKARGKVIGMIAVDNLISKRPITEEDRQLLATFADQAATAIHNARMYGIERETSIKLKQLEDIKNDFLSKMSHELKTPLASIKESIKILLRKIVGEVTPNQEKFLTIAHNNAERLAILISELFDAVKMTNKELKLELSSLNISKLIDEVIFDIRPQAEEKNISLNRLFSESLSGLSVHADYNKLFRVLTNLVMNSIKYTDPGGSIIVSAVDNDKEVLFGVEDNGIGIDPSMAERIFDKFYQIENPKQQYHPGVGLGLSIAKEIVEAHGGRIWAKSEGLGKGTKMVFSIPKG